jgi:hypothetical protein
MTETEYLKLKKPAQTDYYNVDDFNDNADILDKQMQNLGEKKADLDEEGKVPLDQLPDSIKVYEAGETAPENTSILWIDTANESVIKYYNGTEWVPTHSMWAT